MSWPVRSFTPAAHPSHTLPRLQEAGPISSHVLPCGGTRVRNARLQAPLGGTSRPHSEKWPQELVPGRHGQGLFSVPPGSFRADGCSSLLPPGWLLSDSSSGTDAWLGDVPLSPRFGPRQAIRCLFGGRRAGAGLAAQLPLTVGGPPRSLRSPRQAVHCRAGREPLLAHAAQAPGSVVGRVTCELSLLRKTSH